MGGAITFKVFFEPGILPEVWPERRQRKPRSTRNTDTEPVPEHPAHGAMDAASVAIAAAMEQAREEGQLVDEITQAASQGMEITTEIIEAKDRGHEIIITAEDDPENEPLLETMTVHYDVPGSARKVLANDIGEAIGAFPANQATPCFAEM